MRQLQSGVPLGGIGAGKIEFCADGRFTNVTTNNNWDAPIVDGTAKAPPPPRIKEGFPGSIAENATRRRSIYSAEGVPGAWMAIHTNRRGARLLKSVGRPAFSPLSRDQMAFKGVFPRASVRYSGLEPLRVRLEAFSALDLVGVSSEYQTSSLPLALFHFNVLNTDREIALFTLVFSWQNLNGMGGYPSNPINKPDFTVPQYRPDNMAPGLWFGHKHGIRRDPRVLGDYSLRVRAEAEDARISYCAGWNPQGDGRDVWDHLTQKGCLSNRTLESTAGALAVQIPLKGGQSTSVAFALAWYFPRLLAAVTEWEHLEGASSAPPNPEWLPAGKRRPNYGHAYDRWFEDSWSVAGYGLRHASVLYRRTVSWQRALSDSNLPALFTDRLCNDLFPLFSNTWYTKDGKYTVNEAPTDMKGCLGTIDQRSVANAAVACAFPGLDRAELELFAADQVGADDARRYGFHWNTTTGRFDLQLDREGAILHDVGWDHLEGGRIGRPGWQSAHWPDLSSVFVLQVYQHAIWNGASDWLAKMYPHVQAALRFQARLDQNGDGLPDLWGSGCCTYDTELYPYFGSSSFVATLYLAALRAAEKMALLQNDGAYAGQVRSRYARANQAMQDLWDESKGHFLCWRDQDHRAWAKTPNAHKEESLNCHIAQLAGAWWADLLCLGDIVDPVRRVRALQSIDRLNVVPVAGCPANEASPDGTYSESWPSYALAYYAAQAISAGLPEEGWRAVERIFRVYEKDGSFWDTPLEWAGKDNRHPQWGRWYMSSPASLYVLLAFSGVRLDLLHHKMRLEPSWPVDWGDRLERLSVFLPELYLQVDCDRSPERYAVSVTVKRITRRPVILHQVYARLPLSMDPTTACVKLEGFEKGRVVLEPDGQMVIHGMVSLEKDGDGFSINATLTER